MSQKPTILFDLDGTLLDSAETILDAFYFAYNKFNLPLPKEDEIRALIGYELKDMFKKLKAKDVEAMIESYSLRYKSSYLDNTYFFSGAKEAVLEASSFADIAVVTTKAASSSRPIMQKANLSDKLTVIVGRGDTTYLKPHPEPILKALSLLNKSTKNAFMVGDTKLDMLAAKAAGVVAIGVRCGYGDKDELAKESDYLFDDVKEAVDFIKKLKLTL
ncbi:HAD family hydrolase [uncultured Campylobacter sp.]|uniref:HAD family hydrolase n=1 Tax=uncultured Campylobacter sp. TaxID=218934 RepID=UPI0026289FC9|nr:HAD family hydrolase [uncultured Campylobacter sp.]